MKYCPKCGSQMADDADFCIRCGTACTNNTGDIQQVNATPARASGRQLHCPSCISVNISPVVETTNTGGIAFSTPVSRRLGITNYSNNNIHRNYWVCSSCGEKFRNIQNLKEELTALTKKDKPALILAIISAIFAVMCSINLTMFFMFGWIFWGLAILITIVFVSNRTKIKKLHAELSYLKRNCFG